MNEEVAIVFFVDRSLGKTHVVNALREIGVAVERHDDHFDRAETDEVWLQAVAAKEWVVLTADKRIAPLTKFGGTETDTANFALSSFGKNGDRTIRCESLCLGVGEFVGCGNGGNFREGNRSDNQLRFEDTRSFHCKSLQRRSGETLEVKGFETF